MAAQHLLSHHCEKRDKYGLPIVKTSNRIGFADESGLEEDTQRIKTWNTKHHQLVSHTERAHAHIQKVVFIVTWLMPHLRSYDYPSTRALSGAVINSSNDKLIGEEIDLLKRTAEAAGAEFERLAHASAVMLEQAVSNIPDKLSPRAIPENLHGPPHGQLRVWGSESHTKYDKHLGFLCSARKTCKPALNFEELKQRGALSVTSLQSHCENQSSPSDWISLSGEASWMLEYINKKWPAGSDSSNSMRIALIGTAKMERLNLLFDRSDILVHTAGGKPYSARYPDGVHYAWHNHYLVYRWIPVQCIVKTFTLAKFRDICKNHNVQPDNMRNDPFILLEEGPDASVGSILQDFENLGV
ncbi:MAG: hypothetical protein Q9163_000842 [Psora crenata]